MTRLLALLMALVALTGTAASAEEDTGVAEIIVVPGLGTIEVPRMPEIEVPEVPKPAGTKTPKIDVPKVPDVDLPGARDLPGAAAETGEDDAEAPAGEDDAEADAAVEAALEALGGGVYRRTWEALRGGEVLGDGSRGDAAKGLQQTLIAFDRKLAADGIVGPRTLDALNAVQAELGLGQTRTLDAEGYGALLVKLAHRE